MNFNIPHICLMSITSINFGINVLLVMYFSTLLQKGTPCSTKITVIKMKNTHSSLKGMCNTNLWLTVILKLASENICLYLDKEHYLTTLITAVDMQILFDYTTFLLVYQDFCISSHLCWNMLLLFGTMFHHKLMVNFWIFRK